MKATVSWWDLGPSEESIDSLGVYLRDEGVRSWTDVRGLVLKVWVSDRQNNRWGAIQIWEKDGPGEQPLPPNRATELIGYPPSHRSSFDVEAFVQGRCDATGPARPSFALEDMSSTGSSLVGPNVAGAM